MKTPVEALYDQAIKTVARRASGAGRLDNPDVEVTVDNPLCGDRVTIGAHLSGDEVHTLGHRVRGCLLCEAAASSLGSLMPGQDRAQLVEIHAQLEALLNGADIKFEPAWEELDMFAPVRDFKSRHRCVTLPFEALLSALDHHAKDTR